jgi:hypothetical protein
MNTPTTDDVVEVLKICMDSYKQESHPILFGVLSGTQTHIESQQREIDRLKTENKAMEDHICIACGATNEPSYSPVTICGIPIAKAIEIIQNHSCQSHEPTLESANASQAGMMIKPEGEEA